MKILITGGAGFIGSHTVVALSEAGYEPVIIDNFSNSDPCVLTALKDITGRDIVCERGDVRDEKFLTSVFDKHADATGVVHFAAYKAPFESTKEPLKYYENNISTLITLLKVMRLRGVGVLVFSSSASVYGEPACNPVPESADTTRQTHPYGHTKAEGEHIIADLVASLAVSTVTTGQAEGEAPFHAVSLRYFNPIGAHPSGKIGELPLGVPNNLVPYMMQSAAGIRNALTVYGDDYPTTDGSCVRDYIHVCDLADAHVAALDHLLGSQGTDSAASTVKSDTIQVTDTNPAQSSGHSVFNVGTGCGTSVLELINAFEKSTGEKLPYTVGKRRTGDMPLLWADTQHIESTLKWKAKRTVEDALRDAWKWQRNISGQSNE